MATNQFQSHTGSDGSSPTQRIQSAGYTNANTVGENAYSYAASVTDAMEAFLLDWGVSDDGHRANIQQMGVSAEDAYRDVGIGLVTTGSGSSVGPMVVTQDFASQTNEQAQVVGVAFNDTQGTGFYAAGEGVGNVQVTAVNTQTGQVSSTQTWASGGYELALNPGQYQLIASVNNQVIASRTISISNVNVEQDFIMSQCTGGRLPPERHLRRPAPHGGPDPVGDQAGCPDPVHHHAGRAAAGPGPAAPAQPDYLHAIADLVELDELDRQQGPQLSPRLSPSGPEITSHPVGGIVPPAGWLRFEEGVDQPRSSPSASPKTVTVIRRRWGLVRCSQRKIPCQVPRSHRPALTGTVSEGSVRIDRMWADMSSGPSLSCT